MPDDLTSDIPSTFPSLEMILSMAVTDPEDAMAALVPP